MESTKSLETGERMGEGIVRELGMDAYTLRMDNHQGPTVLHRELCSMFCGILDGGGLGENGYMFMYV